MHSLFTEIEKIMSDTNTVSINKIKRFVTPGVGLIHRHGLDRKASVNKFRSAATPILRQQADNRCVFRRDEVLYSRVTLRRTKRALTDGS
jgi:hypothetical protein